MHGEVHVKHTRKQHTNYYLRCTKSETHDRVRKHVIRYIKRHVPRFLILEQKALQLPYIFLKDSVWCQIMIFKYSI